MVRPDDAFDETPVYVRVTRISERNGSRDTGVETVADGWQQKVSECVYTSQCVACTFPPANPKSKSQQLKSRFRSSSCTRRSIAPCDWSTCQAGLDRAEPSCPKRRETGVWWVMEL